VISEEARSLLDRLSRHININQGFFPERAGTVHEVQARLMGAQVFSMDRLYLLNEDGSTFKVQNEDGTFRYLPGFDGPFDPEAE
jgi:hypothetical protein